MATRKNATQSKLLLISVDREKLSESLQNIEAAVTAVTPAELTTVPDDHPFDLIVADLPSGQMSELHRRRPGSALLMIGPGAMESNWSADDMAESVIEALPGVVSEELFQATVRRLLNMQQMRLDLYALRQSVAMRFGFDNLIGISDNIRQLRESIHRVAPTDITVLLQGPAGSGKELAARVIHYHSKRQKEPFIEADFSAIPEPLADATIFGSSDGQVGLLQAADGGTLFLAEVSRIPRPIQERLAAFLQNLNLDEAGVSGGGKLDIRILAASDIDITDLANRGEFGRSLAGRLSVVRLDIAPLRERRDDIEMLTEYFLRRIASEMDRTTPTISRAAIDKLHLHQWPGSVQELENCLRRALALCPGPELLAEDIMFVGSGPVEIRSEAELNRLSEGSNSRLLDDGQRSIIVRALHANEWNFTQTAQELGIGRTTLWRKVKKYRLKRGQEVAVSEPRETTQEIS
jgi:DNA-binding NtrC family response regulator